MTKRRSFLKGVAAASLLSGCTELENEGRRCDVITLTDKTEEEYDIVNWDEGSYGFRAKDFTSKTEAEIEILDKNTDKIYDLSIEEGFVEFSQELKDIPDANVTIYKTDEHGWGDYSIAELEFYRQGICEY